MTRKQRGLSVDLLCLALLYGWVAVYSYPYFFESMAHNVREIQSYNLDSMMMLKGVQQALGARFFYLRFNDYGHFYFNAAIAIAQVYSLARPLTEHALFFILRLVSLLGGCASIALVYIFANRFLGRIEAIFAATAMAFSPALLEYSNEVKPDSWQVFFITLSLYFLACAVTYAPAKDRDGGRRWPRAAFGHVLAASAAAGAAFGTKYLGMFLIPLLLVAGWMVPLSAISDRFFTRTVKGISIAAAPLALLLAAAGYFASPEHVMGHVFLVLHHSIPQSLAKIIQVGRIVCFLASALCVALTVAYIRKFNYQRYRAVLARAMIFCTTGFYFAAAFAVSSPWLLYHLAFVREIYLRSAMTSSGQWFGFNWLVMIFGISGRLQYFGFAVGALSVLGSILVLAALWRRKAPVAALRFAFVLGFVLIFIALLMTEINRATVLYGLPIVPPIILLAAFGLHEIFAALSHRLNARKAIAAALVFTAVLMATQIWQGASALMQYPALMTSLTPENNKLGAWLIHCVPARARIYAASYSYVPPYFPAAEMGEGYESFSSFNPDIVTINWIEVKNSATGEGGQGGIPYYHQYLSDRARYYDAILHSGRWQPGPAFGTFQVYRRTSFALDPVCR